MLDPKEEIKQKLDIADVIGGYLTLKPAGSGSFKAVCPFHSERTPSFHISRERQIWHCFGCDKGGDVFAFVMELEGMTFPEAMRHLGKQAGVEVTEFRPAPQHVTDARESLLAINDMAQKFYAALLAEHPEAQAAREYLAGRGITPELIKKFGLGYAPDRWDGLGAFLATRKHTRKAIIDSGLAMPKKSGDGTVDRFRHRIMIPLFDAVGNVVGFTGRMMPHGKTTGEDSPKYMNSPESAIYHKGETLYGLHLAKAGIRSAGCVIIVEGNLDVVASHKAGVENIVASSGTALTEAQLRMLSRYTKTLVFALDGDAAGVAAAKRVFDLAIRLQTDATNALKVSIRCLIIPADAGKDPDDVVQKDPELWRTIAGQSREVIEFFFDHTLREFEAGRAANIEERKKLISQLIPEVARLRRPDERHLYLLRLVDATHVELPVLQGLLDAATPATAGTGQKAAIAPKRVVKQGKFERAAEFIVGLMLADENICAEISERLPPEVLPAEPWGRLYREALKLYNDNQIDGATDQSLFSRFRNDCVSRGAEDDVRLLDAALIRLEEQVRALPPDVVRAELDQHIDIFKGAFGDARRRALESAIREAETRGSTDTLNTLLAEYAQLLRTLGE